MCMQLLVMQLYEQIACDYARTRLDNVRFNPNCAQALALLLIFWRQ